MLMATVDNLLGQALALFAPPRCECCGLPAAGPVCARCRAALPWNTGACRRCALPLAQPSAAALCTACFARPPPQERTWAAFRYAPPLSQHIVQLKFNGRLARAHLIGTLMAEHLAARPEPLPQLLIPVPLHRARLQRRGFNQALELARALGRRLVIEVAPQAARRTRPTGEQTRLSAAGRRHNVRRAFTVGAAVRGRDVALLDDVITTGATVAELARTAREAGAARIEVWAAARAVLQADRP
jgi:ComF family protein